MTKIETGINYFHKYNINPKGNQNKKVAYQIAEECLLDFYNLLLLFQKYEDGFITTDEEMVKQFYKIIGVKKPPKRINNNKFENINCSQKNN